MFRYLLWRAILLLPTLFIVASLTFFLSKSTSIDPIERLHQSETLASINGNNDLDKIRHNYTEAARSYKQDKAPYYFSLISRAKPDTLHLVFPLDRRKSMLRLLEMQGDWAVIQDWHTAVFRFNQACLALEAEDKGRTASIQLSHELLYMDDANLIRARMNRAEDVPTYLSVAMDRMADQKSTFWDFLPSLRWNGIDNQFHHWLFGFLSGDWGISLIDRQPVLEKIKAALPWSITISALSILFAFGITIILAIRRKNIIRGQEDSWSNILVVVYAIPEYLIAMLLVLFFSTREYGMKLIPSIGIGNYSSNESYLSQLPSIFPHLIVPIGISTVLLTAYLYRQLSSSISAELPKAYIQTAIGKGLSAKKIIRRHAFRNALSPLVTLLAVLIPLLISGSLILEAIFDIPGTGRLTLDSIFAGDWNVVFPLVMLGAFLNILGYWLADLLNYMLDPKISFDK